MIPLKKKSALFLSLYMLIVSGCSSQPVERYPVKRSHPNTTTNTPSRAGGKSAKEKPPKITTETVYANNPTPQANPTSAEAAHPMLSSNPLGVSAEQTPPIAPTNPQQIPTQTATTTENSTVDYLGLLKNPATSPKVGAEIIQTKLTEAQLEDAAKDASLSFYRPDVLFKLGEAYQKKHNNAEALGYFRSLVSQYPQHPLSAQARGLIELIQSSQDTNSRVVGAILPLSGKNANIGQHALNAIRMGLGLNQADPGFRLAIFDTQSSPELAAAGVDKLIREDKAIALIGGLSSKEASTIAQRADSFAVPFIGLSQKAGLTNIGEYVFRNSLTAEMQVDQLVQYAFEKLSARRFAILYPNDTYGVEFSNHFWDHVLARGGQVTAAQAYDPKENDFTTVIQKLVGTYYIEARLDEYKQRVDEIKKIREEKAEKNKAKTKPTKSKNLREHEVQETVLKPIVDFDVLFLPDSGKTLGQVIAFMKVNDVTKLTYLGTNIWNTPDIVKRSSSQGENIYFVDAIDPNDNSIRQSSFFKDYLATYNEEPTLIEMQAFESAKIIKEQVSSGGTSRDQLATRLRSMGKSSGITGELRMSSQREIERPIHILSLDHGLIKTVQ